MAPHVNRSTPLKMSQMGANQCDKTVQRRAQIKVRKFELRNAHPLHHIPRLSTSIWLLSEQQATDNNYAINHTFTPRQVY